MWFGVWLCLIFFTTQCLSQVRRAKLESEIDTKEIVDPLTDVLKNITKANKIIVEFVKNYEQLQKLYKSQESFEASKSENKIAKPKKRHRTNKSTTRKDFPGTSMDYVYDKKNAEDDDDDDENNVDIASSQAEAPKVKDEASKSEKSSESKSVASEEERVHDVLVPTPEPNSSQQEDDEPESQLKEDNNNVGNGLKTRFEKVPVLRNGLSELLPEDVKVKRVVHAEKFSSNKIWNDITNNKPINLEKEIEQPEIVNKDTRKDFLSGDLNRQALILISKLKKKQDVKHTDLESSSIFSDEDEILKDQLKRDALRSAYNDACVKVTIKKCYKAMLLSVKLGCSKAVCKSKFKEQFKKYARTECIAEFDITRTNKTVIKRVTNKKGFVDYTRNGKYDLADECLPIISGLQPKSKPRLVPTRLRNETPFYYSQHKDLNILRDQYESACQRASRAKCKRACVNTLGDTCGLQMCNKILKKYMKKSCKEACRIQYKLTTKYSSDDSDYDDSDDYYDSDSY